MDGLEEVLAGYELLSKGLYGSYKTRTRFAEKHALGISDLWRGAVAGCPQASAQHVGGALRVVQHCGTERDY